MKKYKIQPGLADSDLLWCWAFSWGSYLHYHSDSRDWLVVKFALSGWVISSSI